jgi:multidrug efflux pump subunit AcrA (membrane-fusion protein)
MTSISHSVTDGIHQSFIAIYERSNIMKNLAPLIAGGLTLLVVLAIGVFSFLPAQPTETPTTEPAAGPIVIPAVDTTPIVNTITEREAVYQNQIQELDQALQARQSTYASQTQTLNSQILAAQNQLAQLKTQDENLAGQISQLEATRNERLGTYQSQLTQLNTQYNERLPQLQNQLAEAQAKLAEVNAQLGQ